MNKKLLILALSLLMLAAIAPVMADPTNGKKVPVVQISGATITQPTVCPPNGLTYPYNGLSRLTGQNHTAQRRDYGQILGATLIIGETTLVGKSFNNYDRMINFFGNYPVLTGMMMVYHYDAIWDFPTAGGGFEGNINMVITDYNPGPPATYQAKFTTVLHGYGAFEGQTLQFTYSGPSGQPWEGYLLKP